MRRFGAGARALIRDVCSFEFLGLCTMLLPALMASIGFFFGQTVTPLYFYISIAGLLVCAFVGGWKRGLAYVALLAVCAVLTMFTFSYTVPDARDYHFPMQHLLRHGWNPVFDSTVEKFYPLIEGTHLRFYHTLFLPRFQELCGAIVSSAFRLFVGDGFLGCVLIACLFATCLKFARRYWNLGVWLGLLFACGLTFNLRTGWLFSGFVDCSAYASFCVAALSLVLYRNGRKLSDLVLFVVSACICMTTKTTGILCVGVLVLLTLPLLWKRTAYWHALLALGLLVAVVGASPFLTSWIHYGYPVYPFMTFDPKVPAFDITGNDFSFNADALSMGYFSRICYAWISPKLTIAAIRLFKPDFNPVFSGCGGCEVTGIGLWFNILLLVSVVLLAFSRKNLVTWLCVVIFVSANFAPLKYIGYDRYFPHIWAIFPLAAMNFIGTNEGGAADSRIKALRKALAVALVVVLVGLSMVCFSHSLCHFGWRIFCEGGAATPDRLASQSGRGRRTVLQLHRRPAVSADRGRDVEGLGCGRYGCVGLGCPGKHASQGSRHIARGVAVKGRDPASISKTINIDIYGLADGSAVRV